MEAVCARRAFAMNQMNRKTMNSIYVFTEGSMVHVGTGISITKGFQVKITKSDKA